MSAPATLDVEVLATQSNLLALALGCEADVDSDELIGAALEVVEFDLEALYHHDNHRNWLSNFLNGVVNRLKLVGELYEEEQRQHREEVERFRATIDQLETAAAAAAVRRSR